MYKVHHNINLLITDINFIVANTLWKTSTRLITIKYMTLSSSITKYLDYNLDLILIN